MTEIEKLFENAGIKGEWRDYRTKNGKIYEGKNPKNRNIRLCKPRFTAEKQIELIKKIGNINIDIDIDNGCYMSSEILEVEAHCDEFEETLAEFVNNLWQDLTDQEKEEIRNILNA